MSFIAAPGSMAEVLKGLYFVSYLVDVKCVPGKNYITIMKAFK